MQAGGAEGGGGEGAGGLGGDNAAVVLSARPAFISKTSTTTSPVAEEAAALTQLSTLRVASRHTCGGIRTFEHICVDHVGVGLLIQGWVSYRLWSTVWDRTGGAEVQSAQSGENLSFRELITNFPNTKWPRSDGALYARSSSQIWRRACASTQCG